ncbi:hypothetical protein DH2020_029909 [Rehmannia glutinosa]|uniref:Uncharacterized protein n=1 Tax=Rehmannia glutinosa TaxID=99300 RepID=A0ABR0VNX0_REHGL
MFYSQFILAKKGPLGTIWIAAHLERKLRKNQVADTDIGVSVDSILFPEVPIALRLSSHLLLGVVRIYNRKVNYLFDDCSEALLKVKQAFRSTAVDLPPEESKAPYHSITLPEKFDLDDFELPDSDIFQGNSREQITLQDVDHHFLLCDASSFIETSVLQITLPGLDDGGGVPADHVLARHELFLDNIGNAGHANESADPQTSFGSMSPLKQEEDPEDRAANSESMVDGADEHADLMDYAQAPRTPGLVEEPNLSNVKDASACDDHLESEYHLMESTVKENADNVPYEDKQEVDWCSRDDTISDTIPLGPHEENGYLLGGLEIKESKPQGESPIEGNVEFVLLKESSSVSEPSTHLLDQIEAIRPDSEFTDKIIKASDVPHQEDSPTEAVNEDKTYFHSVDETDINDQRPNEVGLEKSASEISGLASTAQQVSEDVSRKDLASPGVEVPGCVGDTSNQQKSCHDGSELASENQVEFFRETPESQACQEITDSSALNLEAHGKEVASESLVFSPCNSILEHPDVTKPGDSMSTDADVKSDNAALATYGMEETAKLGTEYCITGNSEQSPKEDRVQELASEENIQVATSEADAQVHNMNSQDRLDEIVNNSRESELAAPEKLLSVPEGYIDVHRDMLVEVSPSDFGGHDEGDGGSKTAAGRKRSITESTLTEQSLNSVESSRQVRVKRTIGSVPDDDDLLSSILAGRRSSVLKVKPTPPLSEVTSTKRNRAAPRSGAPKRKVLMDDTMVLHGDTIRHQLTNTEDIRRVRKKTPCTLPEISMIQKQHMEDEIFLGTTFTGISVELASLHGQAYDLSHIRVCKNDVNDASLEIVTDSRLPSQDDKNGASLETMVEPNLASLNDKDGASLETVAELHLTSPNNENNDKGPGKSGLEDDELLIVRNNEVAEPSENLILSEIRVEEVDCTSTEVNFSQEQSKPTNDVGPDDSQMEASLNVAKVGVSLTDAGSVNPSVVAGFEPLDSIGHATSDIGDASAGMVPTASLNEYDERNSHVNMDASAVVPDQKMAVPSVELDRADIDDAQAIARGEMTDKDGDANREGETELGARDDDILPDVAKYAAVEPVPNANHGELEYNFQSEIYNTAFEEQREVEFSHGELVSVLEDGSTNNGENPEHAEAYQPSMMDAEISGFDLHDRDVISYKMGIAGYMFMGTMAVSKYLQAAFGKEAECGRKSLSMDNLLTGKSRKEASRMFFETLENAETYSKDDGNSGMQAIRYFATSVLEEFPEKASNLEARIRDVANEAEDIIAEDIIEGNDPYYHFENKVKKVTEKIDSIAVEVMNIKKSFTVKDLRPNEFSAASSSHTGKNDMVCLFWFHDSFVSPPDALFELIHLRYLAFYYDSDIPSAISKLRNLQTLIIHPVEASRNFGPARVYFTFLDLSQLRHLVSAASHALHIPEDSFQSMLMMSQLIKEAEILYIISRLEMAYAALVSLAQTIHHILNHHQYSISIHENGKLRCINKYIVFLQTFLEDFPGEANSLEGRIRDVAYETEDMIECFVSEHISSCSAHQGSLGNFRLLRVLDVLNVEFSSYSPHYLLYPPDELFELFHLRYLALAYPQNIPAAISNLQNLQTLIIHPVGASWSYLERFMVHLPRECWCMPNLRHLVSSSSHALCIPEAAVPVLENLQTLSVLDENPEKY